MKGGPAMISQLLQEQGLVNLIGGSHYNFRQATNKDFFAKDIERLLEQAEMTPETVYTAKQVHGTNIAYGDGKNGEKFVIGRHFKDTDGLITNKKEVALLIKFADCTPIVLYDPAKQVQASIHSGWRGTAAKISHIAIRKMVKEFGSKKENILAYVGPSIDLDNYEVGFEVYEAFSNHPTRELYFKKTGQKYLLDMSLANYQLLIEAGIPAHNIDVSTASTFKDHKLHSARQTGENYSLNAIITSLIW